MPCVSSRDLLWWVCILRSISIGPGYFGSMANEYGKVVGILKSPLINRYTETAVYSKLYSMVCYGMMVWFLSRRVPSEPTATLRDAVATE